MGEVILGVDFGSKRSGFTAAAALVEGNIHIYQCTKGDDADLWLQDLISRLEPNIVGIDAPLSLPGVYTGLDNCDNYHYRHCDVQAGAMSPMFIGGLTARAMSFSHWLSSNFETKIIEVYPKLGAKRLELSTSYKKDKDYIGPAQKLVEREFEGCGLLNELENWHQFDAVLALLSTVRYAGGNAQKIGLEVEGLIYF